jgi:hypothetical protein
MKLDTDFDSYLSADEVMNQPPEQIRLAEFMLPAFDDDRDGRLSLAEYRFSPLGNPMATWTQAYDEIRDGTLSQGEFRFRPGLDAICAEYFRRLDTDKDDSLTLDEFTFITQNDAATSCELIAQYQDGTRLRITIPGYGMIFSPKLAADGNQVLVDGWRTNGPSNLSRIFVVNLQTDEVLDVGRGFVPAWAPNARS